MPVPQNIINASGEQTAYPVARPHTRVYLPTGTAMVNCWLPHKEVNEHDLAGEVYSVQGEGHC